MAWARFPRTVGRYVIGGVLAQGGMAAVHIGRVQGANGFARLVAVKRMLPHFAGDPAFKAMFVDEARLAARVRHPNVVPTFDVVSEGNELCIVMEYVHGVSLAQLLKLVEARGKRIPPAVGATLVRDALEGLHAAHEAVDDRGVHLAIVHRDVSPQNILVGADGIARVLDFGVAKANVRLHQTRSGDSIRGKIAYMAPEQLEGGHVGRASDLFAASVVFWETLTGERLHAGANEGEIVFRVLTHSPQRPSHVVPAIGTSYDAVVLRGLAKDPAARYGSAREMALAVAEAGGTLPPARVAKWLDDVVGDVLDERNERVRELEETLWTPRGRSLSVDPEATRSAVEAWTPRAERTGVRKRSRVRIVAALVVTGAALSVTAFAFRQRLWRADHRDLAATASTVMPPSPPLVSAVSSPPAPTAGSDAPASASATSSTRAPAVQAPGTRSRSRVDKHKGGTALPDYL